MRAVTVSRSLALPQWVARHADLFEVHVSLFGATRITPCRVVSVSGQTARTRALRERGCRLDAPIHTWAAHDRSDASPWPPKTREAYLVRAAGAGGSRYLVPAGHPLLEQYERRIARG